MKRFLALAVCTVVAASIGCSSVRSTVWPFSNALSSTNEGLPPADGTVVQTEYLSASNTATPPSVLPAKP